MVRSSAISGPGAGGGGGFSPGRRTFSTATLGGRCLGDGDVGAADADGAAERQLAGKLAAQGEVRVESAVSRSLASGLALFAVTVRSTALPGRQHADGAGEARSCPARRGR